MNLQENFLPLAIALVVTVLGPFALGFLLRWLAPRLTKFLAGNMPAGDTMKKLDAAILAPKTPRARKPLTPTAEPFVLSAIAFVIFLVLSFILLRPPTKINFDEPAKQTEGAPAAAESHGEAAPAPTATPAPQ
jgi:hypothetical protein